MYTQDGNQFSTLISSECRAVLNRLLLQWEGVCSLPLITFQNKPLQVPRQQSLSFGSVPVPVNM